jgi:hypothetical protein
MRTSAAHRHAPMAQRAVASACCSQRLLARCRAALIAVATHTTSMAGSTGRPPPPWLAPGCRGLASAGSSATSTAGATSARRGRDQHAARRMGQHLAHHLADQQVGQQPALATPAHARSGRLRKRAGLVHDLGNRVRHRAGRAMRRPRRRWSARALQRREAISGLFASARAASCGAGRLVFGVAEDRQHGGQRQAGIAGQAPRPAFTRHRCRARCVRWPAAGAEKHWPCQCPPAQEARCCQKHHGGTSARQIAT